MSSSFLILDTNNVENATVDNDTPYGSDDTAPNHHVLMIEEDSPSGASLPSGDVLDHPPLLNVHRLRANTPDPDTHHVQITFQGIRQSRTVPITG